MATARPSARSAAPAPAATAARRPVAAAARQATRQPTSSGYSGAAGLAAMQRAQEEAAALEEARKQLSGSPFRFFTPPGESREVIVIDSWLEECFFRHEHTLKNPRSGKWDIHCACIREHANCPVCDGTDRASYFALFMTVIDLTPFETKDGEVVPWSKKLLVVKQQQQKKFTRLEERAKREGIEGGMRGMVLRMTRDSDRDAAIGNEIEWEGEIVSEDDLATYVSAYKDQHGKDHDVIGGEPFNYNDLFPMPTEQQLRSLVGGKAAPGSRDGDNEAIGRSSGRAAPGRAAPARGDNWEEGQRGAAPTVRRPARGAPPPAAEPEAEYAEDAAPAVPSRAAPAQGRAAASVRRAPVEQPPARTSLASRRAQLRR